MKSRQAWRPSHEHLAEAAHGQKSMPFYSSHELGLTSLIIFNDIFIFIRGNNHALRVLIWRRP